MSKRRWPPRGPAWSWLVLLLGGAVLHFASYDVIHQPIFTDVSYYLYYAVQIGKGAVPYVDFFEIKTPVMIFAGLGLQQFGEALGIDPLYAVRGGYLLLAAGAATVLGVICIRLSNNRPMAGWIGLLAYCGFNLLGQLPAIGNVPKMPSMLCTGLAMLSVYRGSWFWGGLYAGLAAMDWQPSGGLTFMGVVLAGLCCRGRRGILARIVAGALVATLPFVGFFLFKGALSTFLKMTVMGAFAKASTEAITFGQRLQTIRETAELHCPGEMWLAYVSLLGLLWFPVRLFLQRRGRSLPLMVGLGGYHYGLVAFSLIDFQARIDLFILLNTLAFFGSVLLVDLYYLVLKRARRYAGRWSGAVPGALMSVTIVLLVVLGRPSFLRAGWRIDTNVRGQLGVALADQREVAERIKRIVGDGRVAVVRKQELLYLGRLTSAMPFVSWNLGTFSHYRQEGESRTRLDTLSRLLEPADLEAMVLSENWFPYLHLTAMGPWLFHDYQPLMVSSDNEKYHAVLWYRKDLPPPGVLGVRYLDAERFKEMLPEEGS